MTTPLAGRRDAGLLLIRLMLAIVFLFHGSQKLFGLFGGGGLDGTAKFMEGLGMPLPAVSATLAGLAEFGGGLVLLTGLLFGLGLLPLLFTMIVACSTAHHGFAAQQGGMEYPLTLAVLLAGLILTGPGRYAFGRSGPGAGTTPGG